jgi:hypothetical protein
MVDDEARPWEPLFTTKPERFTEILLNQDDAARAREYERVQDLLFGEIVRFGFLNHPEQWPPLAALYRYLLDHELPLETRWEVYRHVVGMVENSKVVGAGALTPFFLLDPDRGVASTAALDYTSLAPLGDDDPMSRPKELLQLIDDGEVRNPGAVFVRSSCSAIHACASYCCHTGIVFPKTKPRRRRNARRGSFTRRLSSLCLRGWRASTPRPRMPCSAVSLHTSACSADTCKSPSLRRVCGHFR